MLRAHRHVAEATGTRDAADRCLAKDDIVLLRGDPLQVHAAPPNDAVGLEIGACRDDRARLLQRILAQPGRTAAPGLVDQTVRAVCIEAVRSDCRSMPRDREPKRHRRPPSKQDASGPDHQRCVQAIQEFTCLYF